MQYHTPERDLVFGRMACFSIAKQIARCGLGAGNVVACVIITEELQGYQISVFEGLASMLLPSVECRLVVLSHVGPVEGTEGIEIKEDIKAKIEDSITYSKVSKGKNVGRKLDVN